MTKRERIQKKRDDIHKHVKILKEQDLELLKESLLLSDKQQWYTEGEETWGKRRKKETHIVGRINWIENFIDEGTGDVVPIKRSAIVKIDNEWVDLSHSI